MKSILITFILLFLFTTSCKDNNLNTKVIMEDEKSFPIIIDTAGKDKYPYLPSTKSNTASYNYYYIGKVQDTVYLDPYIYLGYTPTPPQTNEKTNNDKKVGPYDNYWIDYLKQNVDDYKNIYNSTIIIKVDTSTLIFGAYPLWLINESKDTLIVGSSANIPFKMEAKDSSGTWIPIEENYFSFCGVGNISIKLPPDICILSLAPIYSGNYKTLIRVALGNNYSNTFWGTIDYAQFVEEKNIH